jgi:hypothetical protein
MTVVEFSVEHPSNLVATMYGHERVQATLALDSGEDMPSPGTTINVPPIGQVLITNVRFCLWPHVKIQGSRGKGHSPVLYPPAKAVVTPKPAPVAMPKTPTPIFGKDTRRILA